MEGLFSSVLPSLASALAGGTDDERVEALGQLAQVAERRVDDLRELAQRLDALVVGAARERRREGREDGAE